MKQSGTILPNYETERKIRSHYARRDQKKLEFGRRVLGGSCKERKTEGETRFYASDDRYAIVNESLKVLWFERRDDGHFWPEKPT